MDSTPTGFRPKLLYSRTKLRFWQKSCICRKLWFALIFLVLLRPAYSNKSSTLTVWLNVLGLWILRTVSIVYKWDFSGNCGPPRFCKTSQLMIWRQETWSSTFLFQLVNFKVARLFYFPLLWGADQYFCQKSIFKIHVGGTPPPPLSNFCFPVFWGEGGGPIDQYFWFCPKIDPRPVRFIDGSAWAD